jgi:hypothetical protein
MALVRGRCQRRHNLARRHPAPIEAEGGVTATHSSNFRRHLGVDAQVHELGMSLMRPMPTRVAPPSAAQMMAVGALRLRAGTALVQRDGRAGGVVADSMGSSCAPECKIYSIAR